MNQPFVLISYLARRNNSSSSTRTSFGTLNVTRVLLPYHHAQTSGTTIWVGSVGGWCEVPNAGLYVATKFAVRGSLSEMLNAEFAPLGLRSFCIKPGYPQTSFLQNDHHAPYKPRIQDYAEINKQIEAAFVVYNGKQPGNPKKLVQILIDILHGQVLANGCKIPLALPFGSDCLSVICEDVVVSTDFPKGE